MRGRLTKQEYQKDATNRNPHFFGAMEMPVKTGYKLLRSTSVSVEPR